VQSGTLKARRATCRRSDLARGLVTGAMTLALLGGCATLAEQTTAGTTAAAAVAATDEAEARRELAAGVELYDKGEYVLALRSLLMAQGIWQASPDLRVTAHKYVAFSHCLLNRPKPCKQSFSDLLRLKPDFELSPAEAGHPQWSCAFKQARQEAATAPAEAVALSPGGKARPLR
jgi:hypothetical protein